MSTVHDFVAALARAGKGFAEIQDTTRKAYGDLALKKTAIYDIIKKVRDGKPTADQRHCNAKKTKRSPDVVAAVAAAVKEDARRTVDQLALMVGVSHGTILNILHDDLGLVKKTARWVPKLLTAEQKKERVRVCNKLIAAVNRDSKAMLARVVTMDETMVSFHTPETKKQSKQWIKKGQPGPIKARVHATRKKQMVTVFFDAAGVLYTHIAKKGASVNAASIIKVLAAFLKQLKKKRPDWEEGEWFFHWDNAPVHTANVVKEFLARRGVRLIEHAPYSPDLAPADFFYFPKVKEALAGKTLTDRSFKTEWGRAAKNVSKDDFDAAFGKWLDRCTKCVAKGGDYVEK